MKTTEYERSYNFTWNGITEFLNHLKLNMDLENPVEINDFYIDKNTRVRIKKDSCNLFYKTGNKSQGFRIEESSSISAEAAEMLCKLSKLTVKKNRYYINAGTRFSDIIMTVDFVEKPLKIAILEIEALFEITPEYVKNIFGSEIKECSLSAWDLFKRKIGICGGPSSGKTETAKGLSHRINTELNGNAFHVTEYATSFIQKYKRIPNFLDQFFIWFGQRQREEDAGKADIVVSDCPTFLSYIYTLILNTSSYSPELALYFSKFYKRVLFDISSYTDIYLMQLLNYKENNVRYNSHEQSLDIEKRIRFFLDDHKIPYFVSNYANASSILNDVFHINR